MRVVTDVAALDKEFDYLVPETLTGTVDVGTMVRVVLSGRRVGAWVVATGVEPGAGMALRPLAHRRGWGPEPVLIDLAGWAAWRWAGRRSALLTTASPLGAVRHLPAPDLRLPPPPKVATLAARATADMVTSALAPVGEREGGAGPAVVRLPPSVDVTGVIAQVAQGGPSLVVVPTAAGAAVLAGRLRRAGAGVALVPDQWAQARAGAAVVIGARAAAWAPCPGLAAVVVVDGHDEGLHQQQSPTWDAVSVAAERARRVGARCVVTTPCPTVDLLAVARRVVAAPRQVELDGWASMQVVDRRGDDPRLGLYSESLVSLVRGGGRVACVLNRVGRARLLGCRACGTLARCERCGAALSSHSASPDEDRTLACPRCGWTRPWVCASCGSTALRQLRIGVTRAAEELQALAGRPVVEVTAVTAVGLPDRPILVVGTEAVLHRGGRFDAVAFLDFDGEVLAPRFRAAEEAIGLLARASRAVGGRAGPGRVLIQTRVPDHDVILAAVDADPDRVAAAERGPRSALALPPFSALAAVSGEGAPEMVAALAAVDTVEVLGPAGGRWLVRAGDHTVLADALAAVGRPAAPARVAVDPLRV